jgi:hypothetical protein
MYTYATPMKAARGRGGRGPATPPLEGLLLVACALLSLAAPASAQPRTSPSATPIQNAVRALNAGRFDQVDAILKNAREPQAVAIKARADIQRGRYAEAERLLAPVAA